jgi:hypothetical protein
MNCVEVVRCWDGCGTLLLGQLYVGPNILWAPFVTVIVKLMYCLVLWLFLPHQDL